jgi:hypothetical protein
MYSCLFLHDIIGENHLIRFSDKMANYHVQIYGATGIIGHCMSSRETADMRPSAEMPSFVNRGAVQVATTMAAVLVTKFFQIG